MEYKFYSVRKQRDSLEISSDLMMNAFERLSVNEENYYVDVIRPSGSIDTSGESTCLFSIYGGVVTFYVNKLRRDSELKVYHRERKGLAKILREMGLPNE
ncbi:MAG: hypothetical protein AABX91_02450 [Nanoarchaeota archaeon]